MPQKTSVPELLERAVRLHQQGRLAEAEPLYEQVLRADPGEPNACHLLGIVRYSQGRNDEAQELIGEAIAARPAWPEALSNYALALQKLRRFEEALAAFDQSLTLAPQSADTIANRGSVLWDMGRTQNALAQFDAALALKPGHPDAMFNRGLVLRGLGRFEEAVSVHERLLGVQPGYKEVLGYLADSALKLCDWQRAGKFAGQLAPALARGAIIPPLTMLGYSDEEALQAQCAAIYVRDKIPISPQRLWSGTRYRHDRIRIAYLSADFRQHPVADQITESIERHDRQRFEVIGVSLGEDDGSAIRARLVRAFDRFHDARAESNGNVARWLRANEVDILVDLGGHTLGSRPEIAAHRPAPVQVSYLGFPATMGADFVDYVIADRIVVPLDQQPFFTERIVHLPNTYWASNAGRAVGTAPTREAAGLPARGFVFCCFNNHWKIAAPMFDVWVRLLHAVEGSVLWLKESGEASKANLLCEAQARGISASRLVFAGRVEMDKHLARHRLADLFLDTLPYNAHATANDALWAGLPLVTCMGKSFAGRVAASQLHAIGLPELVTQSTEEYEALILKLAREPSLLQSFRQRLERNRSNCPLFDTERFRRHIEAAYTMMWEISERGEAPHGFSVEPIA